MNIHIITTFPPSLKREITNKMHHIFNSSDYGTCKVDLEHAKDKFEQIWDVLDIVPTIIPDSHVSPCL